MSSQTALAQTFEFLFEVDGVENGGEITGAPGTVIAVTGSTIVVTHVPGASTVSHSIQVSSPEDAPFCIDVATTEECDVHCKEEILGRPVFGFLPKQSFVIQNAEDGCEGGRGDPYAASNLDPATHAPRRGLVDGLLFPVTDKLEVGRYRNLPFKLLVPVPTRGETTEICLDYVDGLRGPGQPLRNEVSLEDRSIIQEQNKNGEFLAVHLFCFSVSSSPAPTFTRGDCDGSGRVDISDPLKNLRFQILGEETPPCLDACDTDDSGGVDISDPLNNLVYLFLGGFVIPDPAPLAGGEASCGIDPTVDMGAGSTDGDIGCETSTFCDSRES
jgi:hypothetical protein